MADGLNLTLPERKPAPQGPSKLVLTLLLFLLSVGAVNLFLTLNKPQIHEISFKPASTLSLEASKALALKLEKQGLQSQAAAMWREYLSQTGIEAEEQAKIWYRIGKLFQEAETYDQALSAYYRSESLAAITELEPEINRRAQECLESLGKFAALRYDLIDRVDLGERSSAGDVLAEIGLYKITRAEMDRHIEGQIERQMSALAAFMPEDQRKSQKEILLKRFSAAPERLRLLNRLVLEEILYRKAREDKLTEDAQVRAILKNAEKSILAGQVLGKEVAEHIKITPGDLQTYYEAHKSMYMESEQARISHILVKDKEQAETVLDSLEKGENFADLADEFSLDDTTKNQGGEIDTGIRWDTTIPGIGSSEEALRMIFNADPGTVIKKFVQSDKGVHIIKVRERKPEHKKTFEEVRSEVYQALRSQKETEVMERLEAALKEQYNVVIHASRFQEQQKPLDKSEADDGDQKSVIPGKKNQ